jgi:hypothetical protein
MSERDMDYELWDMTNRAFKFENLVERLERRLEIVARERDAYKAYIDQIMQLKAEALLTQPLPPIVVSKP